jgi:hypothetical protein
MDHDDFATEPLKGLPEQLPDDERIIWQGSPLAYQLAVDAFWFRPVAIYFTLLVLARFYFSWTQFGIEAAFVHIIPFVVAQVLCLAVLYFMAWATSRGTVYTLTNKRVVMRIGLLYTIHLNLPFVKIANASLKKKRNGSGSVVFEILGKTTVSYFAIWPHVRPWKMRVTQPAFRSIANAEEVAQIFAQAAESRVSEPKVVRRANLEQAVA